MVKVSVLFFFVQAFVIQYVYSQTVNGAIASGLNNNLVASNIGSGCLGEPNNGLNSLSSQNSPLGAGIPLNNGLGLNNGITNGISYGGVNGIGNPYAGNVKSNTALLNGKVNAGLPNGVGVNNGINYYSALNNGIPAYGALGNGVNIPSNAINYAIPNALPYGSVNGPVAYSALNSPYLNEPSGYSVPNGRYSLNGPAAYSATGEGNMAINGELPVAGSTSIYGQVPVNGLVRFNGNVPAGGIVSVSGSCGCGFNGFN